MPASARPIPVRLSLCASLGSALLALAIPNAAMAQDAGFQCPPNGLVVRTDTNIVMHWLGSFPGEPTICRASYGDGVPTYWTYALVPASGMVQARRDADYLRTLFPLQAGKPLIFNTSRTVEGVMKTIRGTGVVQDGTFTSGSIKDRPSRTVTISPAPGSVGETGTTIAVGGADEAKIRIDRQTNAILELELTGAGELGQYTGRIHWKAVSLTMP